MKLKILVASLIISSSSMVFACCAESLYHLYPLGELRQKPLIVEYHINRNCKMNEVSDDPSLMSIMIWSKVYVSMWDHDSLIKLKTIDSVYFDECKASYDNFYSRTIIDSFYNSTYSKALKFVKSQNEFAIGKLNSIKFNDTLDAKIIFEDGDTSYRHELNYKNLFKIDLADLSIISDAPEIVSSYRIYETANCLIHVIRLRHKVLESNVIGDIKKKISSIETAVWKEPAQWHGTSRDYFIVQSK